MSNDKLPIEWRPELDGISEQDMRRFKSLVDKGQLAPLEEDAATPHMLLYFTGESLDVIAERMGTPKDVVYLTSIKYNWAAKKEHVDKHGGSDALIKGLRKRFIDHLMIATTLLGMDEVGKVMAGKLPVGKMPMMPRSLHAFDALCKLQDEVNAPAATQQTQSNVIHAENVQINNQIAPAEPKEEVIRVSRAERLKQLSGKADK